MLILMGEGRLIRISKSGDKPSASYIVNEADETAAIEIVRKSIGNSGDDFQDLGRVSEKLLKAMHVEPGKFVSVVVCSMSANSSSNRNLNSEAPTQRGPGGWAPARGFQRKPPNRPNTDPQLPCDAPFTHAPRSGLPDSFDFLCRDLRPPELLPLRLGARQAGEDPIYQEGWFHGVCQQSMPRYVVHSRFDLKECMRKCVICAKPFKGTHGVKTCSAECAAEDRRRYVNDYMRKKRKNDPAYRRKINAYNNAAYHRKKRKAA